jgi:hypothetical protein
MHVQPSVSCRPGRNQPQVLSEVAATGETDPACRGLVKDGSAICSPYGGSAQNDLRNGPLIWSGGLARPVAVSHRAGNMVLARGLAPIPVSDPYPITPQAAAAPRIILRPAVTAAPAGAQTTAVPRIAVRRRPCRPP